MPWVLEQLFAEGLNREHVVSDSKTGLAYT